MQEYWKQPADTQRGMGRGTRSHWTVSIASRVFFHRSIQQVLPKPVYTLCWRFYVCTSRLPCPKIQTSRCSVISGKSHSRWRSQGLLLCFDWINPVLLLLFYLEGVCDWVILESAMVWEFISISKKGKLYFFVCVCVMYHQPGVGILHVCVRYSRRRGNQIGRVSPKDIAAKSTEQCSASLSSSPPWVTLYLSDTIVSAKRIHSPYW